MARDDKPKEPLPAIEDEPGMAERFQRALRGAFKAPPQHRQKPAGHRKEKRAIPKKRRGD